MKRIVASLITIVLLAGMSAAPQAAGDPISGQWQGAFNAMGTTVSFNMVLKLDGEKVTGTLESEHTGAGTIEDGTWKDDKLTMTVAFEKHDSIVFTGVLDKDKLTGEFKTEGFTAPWDATRVKAAATHAR